MDATHNQLSNLQFKRQQRMKVGDILFSKKASRMLQELRLSYQKLVRIQLAWENKQGCQSLSFYQIFKGHQAAPEDQEEAVVEPSGPKI